LFRPRAGFASASANTQTYGSRAASQTERARQQEGRSGADGFA
jgi:hypothetical protein